MESNSCFDGSFIPDQRLSIIFEQIFKICEHLALKDMIAICSVGIELKLQLLIKIKITKIFDHYFKFIPTWIQILIFWLLSN